MQPLQANDLFLIKRALAANSAVLFTGAGFSFDAKNANGATLPSSDQFAEDLWKHLGYEGTRGKETLPRLFEAALKQPLAPLRLLLKQTFEVKSLAGWYQIPASYYWYRVYSTNIDNALELAFKSTAKIKLRVIDGQHDDYQERDQFLEEIQYVKLNGVSWEDPQRITFGFRQYAKRASESPVWYEQFARDFATRVVLFIGSELEEPLFWNAVELRGKKYTGGETRPRSFLIRPKISPADVANLREFNITPIEATAEEFFAYLANATHDEQDRTKVLANAQPGYVKLFNEVTQAMSSREVRDLQQFFSVFAPVTIPDKAPNVRKSFLLGAAPDWNSLHANLDAARDCNDDILSLVNRALTTKSPRVISVTGPAGSGKSTCMKRVALNLRGAGHPVFWSNSDALVPDHVFGGSLSKLSKTPVVFLDNVAQVKQAFVSYLKQSLSSTNPAVFIIADRGNRCAFFERKLAEEFDVQAYKMPLLSGPDIDRILDKLTENGLLGKLQGISREAQRREFSVRAGKQLLVAMREATSGADFDAIIDGELQALEAEELKIIYLAACVATAAGYTITTEQIVALTDLSPAECLAILEGGLKDVVVPVSGNKPGMWIARHRIIAELIVERLASRDLLKIAYIRLLESLARDLPRPYRSASRVFRLYREVINHSAIWSRFRDGITSAREIYESVRLHCQNDHHFWLQYGSLEMEYGELALAEVYVSAAESLAPNDDFVQNTKGSLLYRRAIDSDRLAEAFSLRENAREILVNQSKKHPGDSYPPHILCSHELKFVRAWYLKRDELKKQLEVLRSQIDSYVLAHSYSERLASLQKHIHDAYLDTAV